MILIASMALEYHNYIGFLQNLQKFYAVEMKRTI